MIAKTADVAAPPAPVALGPAVAVAPPAPKVAPVIPIRRWWRTAGLAVAACVALFLIVKMSQGPAIVSHPPDDHTLAERYRDDAEVSCARKDWATCKATLDRAAQLDPAGESEPRVKKARDEIEEASQPGPKGPDKPEK